MCNNRPSKAAIEATGVASFCCLTIQTVLRLEGSMLRDTTATSAGKREEARQDLLSALLAF